MKQYVISLALACSAVLAANAQSDTLAIGYCNGQTATTTAHRCESKAWNHAALRLSSEALSAYKGNSIVGVRAGLVNVLNTDTLTVWLRSERDGQNLAEATVIRKTGTKNVQKGWNRIVFCQPYAITGNEEELYVGYSIRQKASSDIVSIVEPKRIGTSFIKQGTSSSWTDVSSEGVLCVEALVTGNNMPDYDLGLSSATVTPCPSVSATAVQLSLGVHNYGTKAVEGYTFNLSADATANVDAHIATALPSLADTTITVVLDPQVATGDKTQWLVKLTAIDNGTDCNELNNQTAPYYTYTRKEVLEEFTTEKCTACPTGAANIHTLLDKEGYGDNILVVAHHVGYYTDGFTLGYNATDKTYEEEELLWFYNNGSSTYAPGAMFNRKAYFTTSSNKPTPVFTPTNYNTLEAYAEYELQQTTNAMLSISLDKATDGSKVDVHVGGVCNDLYSSDNPYVQVYLIENDIRSDSQVSATGTYYQQHVTRAYNSIWGEPVEWNDKAFAYDCSFTIDAEWNQKNMEVVAFLYNRDADNVKNNVIENGASASLSVDASGIASLQHEAARELARYTIAGMQASASTKGIVIIKMSDGRTLKTIQ